MDALNRIAPDECSRKIAPNPALYDLEMRFRILDQYEDILQTLTLAWPPVEEITDPDKAADLAKLANDEMAELVLKYPYRFVAGIASLPLNNISESLKEIDRTINDLNFRGILIHTPVNDKPLDAPEFFPIYEKMSEYKLPVYLHPMRSPDYPDYRTEDESKFMIHSTFGWPYETTVAMTRLVFSRILENYPDLNFVTHHCGAMVPYFEQRIIEFHDIFERQGKKYRIGLTKAPIDYFKMFYNDTAVYGNTPALMCAYAFCGADHLLFAADMPLGDSQLGYRNYRQTINAIDQMEISDKEKKMIFEDNARKLLRLPI
jgi:predicted TIM-barrel fold metal-dependent hydrolase